MSKSLISLFTMIVVATLLLLPLQEAEAKRFGGGASFGGKSGFSQKYQRSAERSAAPSTAASTQGRPGLGSLLGGLAMGGLLAALFMGGGFENINLFDILILALIGFMLFKLLSRRRLATGGMPSGFDNSQMFRATTADMATSTAAPVYQVPADFNEAEFIGGANHAYRMLQAAWDDGELAEIRALVTDKVFAEIQQQLQLRSGMNRTDIVALDSRLLEIRTVNNQVEVSVMFDCLLREVDTAPLQEARPEQVREVWHFIKGVNSSGASWYLDGIQQLEL